jgi:CTP synthase
MEEQKKIKNMGGTMRLGLYDCDIIPGTLAHKLYDRTVKRRSGKSGSAAGFTIRERHRHRYEFNNAYRERLANAGLRIGGINRELDLVEIIEIPSHPYFIAGQFHPEFLSRPNRPHPLFNGLIKAAKTATATPGGGSAV